MAQQARIETLKSRHDLLDEKLRKANNSSSMDSLDLVAIKRQKLVLKDQIHQLQHH